MKRQLLTVLTTMLVSFAAQAKYIDGTHLSFGMDDNSSHTLKAGRIGLSNNWEKKWLADKSWHISGYWELSYAYLNHDDRNQVQRNASVLAFTPVFTLKKSSPWFYNITPFAEIAIGASLISETRVGARKLSTAFQFEDRGGLGAFFGEDQSFMAKYNYFHYSNGSIKRPNQGLNMHWLTLGYYF